MPWLGPIGLHFSILTLQGTLKCVMCTWALQCYHPCLRRLDIRSNTRGSIRSFSFGHPTSLFSKHLIEIHVSFQLTLHSIFHKKKKKKKTPQYRISGVSRAVTSLGVHGGVIRLSRHQDQLKNVSSPPTPTPNEGNSWECPFEKAEYT